MERPSLNRPHQDRLVAGVCAGLANHLGVSVGVARAGMLVLTVAAGFGGLLYLWLWATVPNEGETEGVVPLRRALTKPSEMFTSAEPRETDASVPTGKASSPASPHPQAQNHDRPQDPTRAPRARWPIAELLLGACLVIAGGGLVLDRLGVHVNLGSVLPALAVLVGVGLTWWQVADRKRPDRHALPRVLGALALVAVGVLMFFVTSRAPSAWTVIAAAIAVLGGVALAIAPWVLRINRELIAERAARAREAERSDIAAHLHDSVLQTLALIQQRSEPGSEVARIARGQERELREWLFRAADGAEPAQEAVDTELRAHAAQLEQDHSVRFEVVGVGLAAGAIAPAPIVAAAREAMLNAARHAGGEVTVYVEASPNDVSIDVTDRGPGIDLTQLPEGRMGVRESILGRMERAGGSARFVAGPGGRGTSVRLSMPLVETSLLETSLVDTRAAGPESSAGPAAVVPDVASADGAAVAETTTEATAATTAEATAVTAIEITTETATTTAATDFGRTN